KLGVYGGQARIVFCGQFLVAGTIPDLRAGVDSYLQALETLKSLDTVLAIPISGPTAEGKRQIRARIATDRDYTQNLVRHVLTALAARLPLERVLSVAREIYEDYPFLDAHLRNLEAVWEEIRGQG